MKKLFNILFLLPVCLFAQHATVSQNPNQLLDQLNRKDDYNISEKATFNYETPEESVKSYYSKLPELSNADCSLQLENRTESPIGVHLFYRQYYKNIPVYGGYLKVNLNKSGDLLSSYNHLYQSASWNIAVHANDETKGDAIFIIDNNKIIPSYKAIKNGVETVTDNQSNLLFSQDMKRYFANDDTTIYATVFRPDPLSHAGVLYGTGGSYRHFNDSDYALINNQRDTVSFPGTFSNDSFRLENQYCFIKDINPPYAAPSVSKQNQFYFTRGKDGFKQCMAMYHIYLTKTYLTSIGFGNHPNYRLKVDATSGYVDQSYFNPSDSTLHFGVGGVPDAEDADVVVHEYTHSVTQSINKDGITSIERHALDEAISDVLATTHSRVFTNYNWRWVFNWDGHSSESWPGRDAGSTKTYLDKINDFYPDCEIWSSAINDIVEEVGRDIAVKLLLTSLSSYTPNTTMPEAAVLFMQSDSILYGKANAWKIGPRFNARKLGNFATGINDVLQQNSYKLYNTASFATGTGDALIELKEQSNITIYNLQGQKVYEKKSAAGELTISPQNFSPGFYVITVENSYGTHTAKLSRF